MYTYQPPKSSVWGHSLGRMPLDAVRSRFDQFLDIAVAHFTCTGGSVLYQPRLDTVFRQDLRDACMSHFTTLLGMDGRSGMLAALDSDQITTCIDAVIRDPTLCTSTGASAVITIAFLVQAWRVGDREAPTMSQFHLAYGQTSRLTTMLKFAEYDEYLAVKQALEDVGLCSLNEKHLKKRRTRKPSAL